MLGLQNSNPMRWSAIVLGPKAPFPKAGNRFDALFVAPQQRPKAWAGQDKDAFFRDKYAHVHAKQLKQRAAEQELKRARQGAKPDLRAASKPAKPAPVPDFHERLQARIAKTPKLEFVYGTNAVRAALKTRPAHKLYTGHRYEADVDPQVLALCRDAGVPIVSNVPQQHLQIMSGQGVHNKLVLETEKRQLPRVTSLTFDAAAPALVVNDVDRVNVRGRQPLGLFIDQVTDTHNMGALLRSALWFGVDFVAVSARNSAPFSPAVVRASSGAAEFVPLFMVDKPLRLFEALRAQDWALVASAPDPATLETHGVELTETPPENLAALDKPTLLVVGSEGDGIRTSLLQRSTHATSIPSQQSEIDSLNVSVATAILLSRCR